MDRAQRYAYCRRAASVRAHSRRQRAPGRPSRRAVCQQCPARPVQTEGSKLSLQTESLLQSVSQMLHSCRSDRFGNSESPRSSRAQQSREEGEA
eukprot:3107816-Pleurochrysis_carterae.AAC.1